MYIRKLKNTMSKYAFNEVIVRVLAITHNIAWMRGASVKESYISLGNYVRNTDPIKHKVPALWAGNSTLLVSYEAFQILEVNELSQIIKLLCVLILYWRYPEIQWNASHYNGISSIELDTSEIWTPTIVIPRSASSTILELPDKVDISSNGLISALMPGLQEIFCFMDLLDFPFDEHNCTVQFMDTSGSSVHPGEANPHVMDMSSHFITSAEWKFEDKGCGFVQEYLNFTHCWFVMKRQTTFYMTTIIAPLVLMSAMTLLVFCLPAESGEKISFIISIFVSMTMFIGIINDVVPRSMNQIPRIVILILLTFIVIFLATIATVFVMNKYKKELTQKLGKTKNKQLQTPTKQSSNNKDAGLDLSMENNVSVFENGGEKATSSNHGRRNWIDDESNQNNKLWASQTRTGVRYSNRISNFDNSKEDVQFESKRDQCSIWMRVCDFTHSQLDTMFFWLFLCVNTVLYTATIALTHKLTD